MQKEVFFEKKPIFIFLGFDKIAELLIENGADVNNVGGGGKTALMHAVSKGK